MPAVLTRQEVESVLSLNDSDLHAFLLSLPPAQQSLVMQQLEKESSNRSSLSLSNPSDERSERNAAVINAATAASQEIGPLPPVKDPARRARCKYDLKETCLTYFRAACYMGLAPYQNEMVEAFQDVLLNGGQKCRAVRRGGLKSTLAVIAAIWAAVNGHRKFIVPVGATDDKSNEQRDNFFKRMAASRELREDFPELLPLMLKWRNPKKQLRLNGEILTCTSKDERGCIVFPSIAGTELSEARVAPYSILATDVSGLAFVDDCGRTIRPDCLLFDDVQTPQSAKSIPQTSERENAITSTFMGLAGLGQQIAAIMVCTVRKQDDLTLRFCDRDRHPDWDGRKFPVLISEPTNKDLWTKYSELLKTGNKPEDGLSAATGFYSANRFEMDIGAKPAWEDDKEPGYVSSIQWAMTTKFLRPDFYRADLQQQGDAVQVGIPQLKHELIIKRLSHCPRRLVPSRASYLTAFVDSQDSVLFWMVMAWQKDFSGWIVDYGTWPDQQRSQFRKSDIQITLQQMLTGRSWEEQFVHAHNELERQLLRPWLTDDGRAREVDLLLKDWGDGDHLKRIESQVMASAQRTRIRPSKGFAPKPGRKRVHLYGEKDDRHTFSDWVERRTANPVHVQFDTNIFKSHAARRLQTTIGAPSSVLLPGDDETALELLCEHLTAEKATPVTYDGTDGTEWNQIVGRDNDWWDCYVGNNVAASMLGCSLSGELAVEAKPELEEFVLPGSARRGR